MAVMLSAADEHHDFVALPGLRPWLTCLTAALFFFYEFLQLNMFNAIDPELMQAFGLTAEQLGRVSAAYLLANLLFLFPAGILLDRFSTRRLILVSMGICVFGTFMFAVSTHIWMLIVFRFMTGIGGAFCLLSNLRLASRWFPAKKMALVTGLIVTMAMIGGTMAQVPLTLLVQSLGWQQALFVDAGLGLLAMLAIAKVVMDHPPGQSDRMTQQHEKVRELGLWRTLAMVLTNSQNWLAGTYTCLLNLPIMLLGSVWGNPYLVNVHHLGRTDAVFVTSMLFIGTIFGSPVVGWIADHLSRRKLPMVMGAIVSLAAMLWVMCVPDLTVTQLMLLFLLLGFVTSTQVITYPLVTESNPRAITGTALSLGSVLIMGGGGFFQYLFGVLIDWHWDGLRVNGIAMYAPADYERAILMMPIGFAVCIFAALCLRETYCRPMH